MTEQELRSLSAVEIGAAGRKAAREGRAEDLKTCIAHLERARRTPVAKQIEEELKLLAASRPSAVTIRMGCRFQRCDASLGLAEEWFCEPHRASLEAWFRAQVKEVAEAAAEFYVGRSNYPERRLLEHRAKKSRGYDRLRVLHWTPDQAEVQAFETALIQHSRRTYDNCANKAPDDETNGRFYGPWNCVYVAWKARTRTARGRDEIEVDHLDEGKRQFPRFLYMESSVVLRTSLRPEHAKELVRARKERLHETRRDDDE